MHVRVHPDELGHHRGQDVVRRCGADHQAQRAFLEQTGDPLAAKQLALQSLANLRDQQALALSYFDTFLIFALLAAALIGLVFFMKHSVVAKGSHVSAE